jgi:hypothetical protein
MGDLKQRAPRSREPHPIGRLLIVDDIVDLTPAAIVDDEAVGRGRARRPAGASGRPYPFALRQRSKDE